MNFRWNIFITMAAVTVIQGCGGGYERAPLTEAERQILAMTVEVEAYLFDAQIRRENKPTSFRLELFQADSVIGIGGRGYLGKGALKGWLTSDSLKVYFPTTDEYVYEAVSDMMGSFSCTGAPPHINLMDLLTGLPDEAMKQTSAQILVVGRDKNHPEYQITFADCDWVINVVYDRQEKGWRIRSFLFGDGKDVRLKAERREYRQRRNVKAERFAVPLRKSSLRISP